VFLPVSTLRDFAGAEKHMPVVVFEAHYYARRRGDSAVGSRRRRRDGVGTVVDDTQ